MKKKFRLATLGCRTNQYETQAYRDQLLGLGYVEAQKEEAADLCIVNTCSVTASADQSSLAKIRQLVRQHPKGKVVVTGCLAEKDREKVASVEGVHKVVSNKVKENLIAELFPEEEVPEFAIHSFKGHTRAFVKVQDGCNSFCTYCLIPYVRGRSRSKRVVDVVREVESVVQSGHKEVVITGINVGDFEEGLPKLMRAVDQVEGIERVRLSSIDPDEVDAELLETILEGKHTCHCLHIVLQSGANPVLKRMNRKYTRELFLETIERLKQADPDFGFTTDVIVGFPGERDEDFEASVEIVRQVGFSKVHMFPYSPRERTRAALYTDRIDDQIVHERKHRLLQVAKEVGYQLRERYVGREMTILTENIEGEMISGHTDNFLKVMVPRVNLRPNELVRVKIEENTPDGLRGSV